MKAISLSFAFSLYSILLFSQTSTPIPDTGISGVYEVMIGEKDAAFARKYWAEFGFRVVDSARVSVADAQRLYGVSSAFTSYRMQNGEIDSHGLLRVMVWDNPLGPGVGYSEPETIGSRMAVMMTADIMRIVDVFQMERENGAKWYPIEPIFDDLFGLSGAGKPGIFNRPAGVRETAIYGDYFNHVFFQRYGYTIPGYGTIGKHSPLKSSEFTHHDFIIMADDMSVVEYYQRALGFRAEGPPEINGDWQKGPKRVFDMPAGYTHWYQGFVSPNNICGKLKFFIPRAPKTDRSAYQRPGELGITIHSLWTPKLQMVYDLIRKEGIKPTTIQKNEFGESSFFFTGPDGAHWQIIEKSETMHKPVTKLEFVTVNE